MMRIRVDHEELSSLYFKHLEYRDEGFFAFEKEESHEKKGGFVFQNSVGLKNASDVVDVELFLLSSEIPSCTTIVKKIRCTYSATSL